MILYCISDSGEIIEKIYRIPSWEIKNRTCAGIIKNQLMNSKALYWYEQYRIKNKEELNRTNDIWQQMRKEYRG